MLLDQDSSVSTPIKAYRPKQVNEKLSSPTSSMRFGDDRAQTPMEDRAAVAEKMAFEYRAMKSHASLMTQDYSQSNAFGSNKDVNIKGSEIFGWLT